MARYILFVPAMPVAQPRPRAVSAGKHARMANVSARHPIHDFKASVRLAWRERYGDGPPLSGRVTIACVFVMPRTKAMTWKTKPMPRVPYIARKNDWDNLGKAVSDALNGVAYEDDGQIWQAHVERWYASGEEAPHVKITITAAEAAGGERINDL